MNALVIVESPTKAKTIRAFLPKGYKVVASMGHIRDLPQSASEIPATHKKKPWAKLGVDVENDFAPLYVVPSSKKKAVKELSELLSEAQTLILATDEDREGESISWHLLEVLKPKVPVKRMVFHEITKEAILESLEHFRDIDEKLVRAQETRRLLDRLVGYTVSPLLWKKIAFGLSAGRVQSVAVRLVVLRERERRAFKSASYFDLTADFSYQNQGFSARAISLAGEKLATGKDFDENTGRLQVGKKLLILNEILAKTWQDKLKSADFVVKNIEDKPITRRPSPPFITSTLQQEANRKLGLPAKMTMRLAQNLYENGFITYMRTDSTQLSAQALNAAREHVNKLFGPDYLPESPRFYASKSKGAQEAHEAIRPAGSIFKHPKETGLAGKELALYDLIWKRTIASQMTDSKQLQTAVDLTALNAEFRANGHRILFDGFIRAYVESEDDSQFMAEAGALPELKTGQILKAKEITSDAHHTEPPARYTEASLVKKLEAEGVGRPSTYASILSTIVDRGYVVMRGQALAPTFTAMAVVQLLEIHFPNLVDLKFTAQMEESLDKIAEGETEWLPYLRAFYSGTEGLSEQVLKHESQIDPEVARTIKLDENSHALVKVGRYGAYLQTGEGENIKKANVPQTVFPAELTEALVQELFDKRDAGPQSLGVHPEDSRPIYLLDGRFGPYFQWGDASDEKNKPKRVALPTTLKPDTATLADAVGWLALPRFLGEHPQGGKITANMGRFGPFICHDKAGEKEYRTLKGISPVQIEFTEAIDLLNQPKSTRGRGKATALRELGPHPETQAPVSLYNGPYGFYVKTDKLNASVPKDMKPEDVTLTQAIDWLKAKALEPKKTKFKRRK